jgi:hypothetical protein
MTMSTIAPLAGEEEAGKQGALGLAGHRRPIIASVRRNRSAGLRDLAMLRFMYARSATRRIVGCQGSPGSHGVVGMAL